jgi:hypothetical protein
VTPSPRVNVFFYGLFMDLDLLRARGLAPGGGEIGSVEGALRIGQRAALVPDSSGRVYGIVASLTPAELAQLYSEPTVRAYQPESVRVRLASGAALAALCYNLPVPPSPTEHDAAYAAKLRAVAEKVGLPAHYVASLE